MNVLELGGADELPPCHFLNVKNAYDTEPLPLRGKN